MAANNEANETLGRQQRDAAMEAEKVEDARPARWKRMLGGPKATKTTPMSRASSDGFEEVKVKPEKWSMGVLNDRETDEVPG